MSLQPSPPKIQILPEDVVNRIAAGEVVQRPVSVAKELIENSLDAQSKNIDVLCSGGGIRSLSISDDGNGIQCSDLQLAATRFATSKLRNYDDLQCIPTFGFRGEALASASMVSRLTIISRQRKNATSCAYKQIYFDGKPKSPQPTPCAGTIGTVVKIEDLFYNIPSRKRAFVGSKKEAEEYNKILHVVQRYAIHMARGGITFVCRKVGGTSDLNTQSISSVKIIASSFNILNTECNDETRTKKIIDMETATKDVIGHVFGTFVARELLTLECSEGDIDEINRQYLTPCNSTDDQKKNISAYDSALTFKAYGLLSNGSYCVPKSSTAFILFINNRLVECPSIKRVLEGIYAENLPRGAKPFIYLSLELPGPHIDVNVHPTKREVALLHEDLLCQALYAAVRNVLCSATSSRTFYTQTLVPPAQQNNDDYDQSKSFKPIKKIVEYTTMDSPIDSPIVSNVKSEPSITSSVKRPASSTQTMSTPAKKLVRINHALPVGSLEPFLTQSQKSQVFSFKHDESCPLFLSNKTDSIDLSQPGAFTKLCKCKLSQTGKELNSLVVQQPGPPSRPKKVIPSDCDYTSIKALRNDVIQHSHRNLATKLRDSAFVGCMSRHRSLIQYDIELLMINHSILSKQLFYQLALSQFGNASTAKFVKPIDVKRTIAHILRLETKKSEEQTQIETTTEWELAEQATQCLVEHVQMLQDYFSFSFEVQKDESDDVTLLLTGLPILLEGHEPCPHALSLFLLRLATEVNWDEEQSCFKDICTEIGAFYSQLPYDEEEQQIEGSIDNKVIGNEADRRVRHILYPALSFLLVPNKNLAEDGSVVKLAMLPSLYKVFERC